MDRPTVEIYEAQAAAYEANRQPTHLARAQAFGARVTAPPAIDLGSGPGWYTAALGSPVVALDAAAAMVRRTRLVAPGALAVQADLLRLPFRDRSLGGGWARNTYVHVSRAALPLALADLHRSLQVDAPVELTFIGGDSEGRDLFAGDDFPGRFFSRWTADRLEDVLVGAGFDDIEITEQGAPDRDISITACARRARTLPDTVGAGMRLLVCGLNPSLHAADAGVGFVTASNRFWPAALSAGLVTRDRDPHHALLDAGVGMTDVVKRATGRADELRAAEYRTGMERLDRLCRWLQPAAVCFVGLAGWRAAVDRAASPGWQARHLGDRPVYVMPSTSGLNAAVSIAALTDHLRAAQAGPEAGDGVGGL